MSALLTDVLYVIGIAFMFLLLIAPHEAGHFVVAKLCGVRVHEFSVGAGMKLWSTTRNGTLYAIRLIPALGYVRMFGMETGEFDQPNGFHTKHPLQQIAILLAGPVANFLVAMVLITGFGLTQLNSDPGKVVGIVGSSAAATAGIKPGDSIQAVDGKRVSAPQDIQKAELAAGGSPVTITGKHADGTAFTVTVTPVCKNGGCQMGVLIQRVATPLTAIQEGVSFPFQAMQVIVQGFAALITGKVPGGLLGPAGFTGPIGIAAITYSAVNEGLANYVWLVALLSVALGVTNLLPFLALDGGRIVVAVLEWVRRRPFDRNGELRLQRWGLATFLFLAVVISFIDIMRLATGQFPGVGVH